ncbi:MAG: radical SAM family heme chaperone HemW [Parvularculales bacterium]
MHASPSAHLNGIPLGIYIHWPFCRSICPYCDFNVHKERSIDQQQWRDALLREIDHTASLIGAHNIGAHNRVVQSVFFGGGTPSLMPPQTVAGILDHIAHIWPVAENIEISLEANPDGMNTALLKDFQSAGINRISLGVQALDDDALRFLGRRHTATQALEAVRLSRRIFDTVSMDLIYGRPQQSLADWEGELQRALAEKTDHLSLYQLTIEPRTPFYRSRERGRLAMPDEDRLADLFEITREICAAANMPAYEISSHGQEVNRCRHNLTYWNGGEYAGIGPGAHGRIEYDNRRFATRTILSPDAWLARVESAGHGLEVIEPLNGDVCGQELIMMGLRLTEGVCLKKYTRLTGKPLNARLVEKLMKDGLIWQQENRLGATLRGVLVLDNIIATLLADSDYLNP